MPQFVLTNGTKYIGQVSSSWNRAKYLNLFPKRHQRYWTASILNEGINKAINKAIKKAINEYGQIQIFSS